jgi:cytochrome P450 family 2 subfamily J
LPLILLFTSSSPFNFFITKVLAEIANTRDPFSSFYGDQGHNNLVASLIDLFAAGTETTSTTLTWAVLYMVREPAVQDRVQVDIHYMNFSM